MHSRNFVTSLCSKFHTCDTNSTKKKFFFFNAVEFRLKSIQIITAALATTVVYFFCIASVSMFGQILSYHGILEISSMPCSYGTVLHLDHKLSLSASNQTFHFSIQQCISTRSGRAFGFVQPPSASRSFTFSTDPPV